MKCNTSHCPMHRDSNSNTQTACRLTDLELVNRVLFETDSPSFHQHLAGPPFLRGLVHIGVLSLSVVLQSFRRLLRTWEKTRSHREHGLSVISTQLPVCSRKST
jgi:hypothetical protein